ncbi:hypothetical protein EGK65_06440 [Citrobacter farmeri]|nr:hypothetical protein EGK65_06440 [Citrobacter farmeri]
MTTNTQRNRNRTARLARVHLICACRLIRQNVTMRGILKWNIHSRMKLKSRAFLFLILCMAVIAAMAGRDGAVMVLVAALAVVRAGSGVAFIAL